MVHERFEEYNEFKVLTWPLNSLDLKPIKHVWDVLDKQVRSITVLVPDTTARLQRSSGVFASTGEAATQFLSLVVRVIVPSSFAVEAGLGPSFTARLCEARGRRLVTVRLQSQFEVGTKQLLIERREVRPNDVGVPEARTPLKSLEEIKLMFQRLSFSPFSALSSPQIKGSPRSLTSRLFPQGKTGSFTLSTPPNSTTDGSEPGQESNLETANQWRKLYLSSRVERGDAGQEEDRQIGDDIKDTKTNPNGARQEVEDLTREVDSESDSDDDWLYEAESPDEAALVHAAQAYRCNLRGRSAESFMVELPGIGSLSIQLLHILPFDPNRKRMSVVVRHPLSGQVVVYTKGADSVIMDLTETPKDSGAEQAQEIYSHIRDQTQKHLDSYARDGLRTLCIAKKFETFTKNVTYE
ncbi:phospholipid-transporting ATPase VD-like [Micropterus dolomieu]|uniref:phospholipid-transporting ATPase VD-like n=1 Tax=Micropterus dolomieu TaxID=147949 RepID=UPI001E8E4134|nr:phospholipid-transporting ATPase VD-like [Micropterus dolomieu]